MRQTAGMQGPGDTRGGAGSAAAPSVFAQRVLEVVEAIPRARVLTYGDVAELVGSGGPRAVGHVLSRYGSAVPWWRVVRAGGAPPSGLQERALQHYAREGTPMRAGRVVLSQARWIPGLGPVIPDDAEVGEG